LRVLPIQSPFTASRSSIHKVSIPAHPTPPGPSGTGYRPEIDGLPIRQLGPSPSAPALRAGAPPITSGRLILTRIIDGVLASGKDVVLEVTGGGMISFRQIISKSNGTSQVHQKPLRTISGVLNAIR